MFTRALRVVGALAVAVLTLTALIAPASAESGELADPDDTAVALDIKEVTHADSDTTITYTLETQGDWTPADGNLIAWILDVDDDGTADACVVVRDDPFDAVVYDCEDPDPGFADATATLDAATNILTVSWPIDALEDAGIGTATSYQYKVVTIDDAGADPFDAADPGADDFAPDEDADETFVTHQLGDATAATTTTTAGATTTSTALTTTTTAAAAVQAVAAAAPATPVSANPSYTG
jgi:hypothetical protein